MAFKEKKAATRRLNSCTPSTGKFSEVKKKKKRRRDLSYTGVNSLLELDVLRTEAKLSSASVTLVQIIC